jgi:GNAT superfamily N-acetyltransferase
VSDWTIDEATPAQREELLRIESRLFGPGSALRARWLFDANPVGKALVLVAVTPSGRIVGTRSLLPWRLIADGEDRVVGQYSRTWTDPDFRKRGISVEIGRELNRRSAALGYPVVILFPSVRSIPGHRKVGNRVDEMLERRQLVTRFRFFAPGAPRFLDFPLTWARRITGMAARPCRDWRTEPDPVRIAGTLEDRGARGVVVGSRDPGFVAWRFSEESGRTYRCWRFPGSGDAGLIAFTHTAGGRAKIVDLWGGIDPPGIVNAVAGLMEQLVEDGATLVEWCPPRYGDWPEVAKKIGLIGRRQGVPLARWFNRPLDELGVLGDISAYRLTEGDSDYA